MRRVWTAAGEGTSTHAKIQRSALPVRDPSISLGLVLTCLSVHSSASMSPFGQLCAFVEQGDVHFPMLTVRETFQFALDNSNADSALLNTPEFCALQHKKVELMLELLGLKECADTVVGDTFLRGVSGGQVSTSNQTTVALRFRNSRCGEFS